MLNDIASEARELAQRPGFRFEHYGQLFSGLHREGVATWLEGILREILGAASDRPQPYDDQVHLVSEGDFNLTLKIVGRHRERGAQLTASEFDLLVVNLTDASITVPVHRTDIDISALHQRPGPLRGPEPRVIEPYGHGTFTAYTEIADLAGAEREAPFLVVHSRARGEVTWVFDRERGDAVGLTDNHLWSSRARLAARMMGVLRGGPEVVETLERVARSNALHFVRWEAAEAVYLLDPARGTALLRNHLAHDTHPAIRTSTRATLDNIAALTR